ncbi:MAG: TldD/PmbA family protein [candidate division Zixibacteria bacterium]|nr:TldD/PmbA family protein [candidate division Zixibacteria bacterium]
MNNKEKLDLAHWVVAESKKTGANDVSVNISNSRDISVSFLDSKLDQLNESTQNSLSLNIYANNRFSGHTTNDLRRESLKSFIQKAVSMTGYLSEDPHRRLPDPKYYAGRKDIDLKLVDSHYDSIKAEQRVELAKELEAIGRTGDSKVVSCSGEYGDTYSESVKVHSNGFEGERQVTVFYVYTEVTIDDGNGGRPQDYDYIVSNHFNKLPSPKQISENAIKRVLRKIGQKKIASGKFDMIIENRRASRLIAALAGPWGGRALQQRTSFLEGKVGEKIASEKLTLVDNPFIPEGRGSRLYDGEGMATKKRLIIDKGVLKQYFINNYYASKLEVEPTGGSTTNIIANQGDRSLDEMVKSMKKGILVTDFLGGNSNGTTGDFSYGIVGQLIEDGKVVHPVNEMNISGNLGEILNQLVELGNDPYINSSWRLPSLKFEGVDFSGV